MVRTDTPEDRGAHRSRRGEGGDAGMAEVMARYCAGDARAFHELYGAVAPKILGHLTGLAGDKATAEDLLQQTFMK
jgi:RNA polymerase sigma-70 factor (ECF subfamily)